VDSGNGGGHGLAYSTLKMNLLYALSGTSSHGDVFSRNQDIQIVISGPGGRMNACSQPQHHRILQLIVPGNGSNGNVYILNVVSGHGGNLIVYFNHKVSHQHVLSGTGGV